MIWMIAAALAAEPTYNDEWKQGYSEGLRDGQDLPLGAAAGLSIAGGALLAGTGVASCGVVGTPCIAAAIVVPAAAGYRIVPIPEQGEWETESSDFQSGYIQGFQESARQRQMRAALAGGAIGAVLGTAGGIAVILFADTLVTSD